MNRPRTNARRRGPRRSRIALALVLGAVTTLCAACGSGYQLRGKVIEGDISFIAVVSKDDPRLDGPGIPGVTVVLVNDPNKLSKETLGTGISDGQGDFSIGAGLVGAGFFRYDAGVTAERRGYEYATSQFNLPASDRRVLIMLRPGSNGSPIGESDAWSDYEKFR